MANMVPKPPNGADMSEWQPIETAPKDGTDILLVVRYGKDLNKTRLGAWREQRPSEFAWLQHHTFDRFAGEVTHWMPLPEPPTKP